MPLYYMMTQAPTNPALMWVGLGVSLVGFACESIGDYQLARFLKDPSNEGKVCRVGLWNFTRHPNYFGDATVWWGFYLSALACGGWWTFLSPTIMNLLLLKVSGVWLLEKSIS